MVIFLNDILSTIMSYSTTFQLKQQHQEICRQCYEKPANLGYEFCSRACDKAYQLETMSSTKSKNQFLPVKSCIHCHEKPANSGYKYCSRTCGRLYQLETKNVPSTKPQNQPMKIPTKNCDHCHEKPANSGYKYCSRTCGQAHKNKETNNVSSAKPKNQPKSCTKETPTNPQRGDSMSYQTDDSCIRCRRQPKDLGYPICLNCLLTMHTQICIRCHKNPKHPGYDYCGLACAGVKKTRDD